MVKCCFPACGKQVPVTEALVPSIAAIREQLGRAVEAADIATHVLCRPHGGAARREGISVYNYTGTLAELENRDKKRAEERQRGQDFFATYRKKKPATAMALAFDRAKQSA